MDELYKINQIAGIFGVSCDTLKLYEKLGFFAPAYVDEKTKYRYYGISEILKLDYILQLKGLNFTLSEIKQVLLNKLSIEEKHKKLIAQHEKIKELIRLFESFSRPADYEVKIKTYPRHYVISEDISVKAWEELVETYVRLTSLMIKHKLKFKPFSNPYAVFESGFSLENFSCRACMEVFPDTSPIVKEIPAQTFITITHKGSYETLGESYKHLAGHAANSGINLKDYAIERYIIAYDNSPLSSDFITEIAFPIDSAVNGN
jgi:Predicted transcriptional regulators